MLFIFILCGVASAAAGRSVDPLVTIIGRDFGVPVELAALISSVYAFPYAFSQPILGPLGDFYGKQRVLTICLWFLAIFLAGCVAAPTFGLLIGARLLAGVASGGVMPIAMAIIADVYPPATRQLAISRFLTASLMGTVIGASVAGVVAIHFGWRSFLAFAAALTLVAALAATLFLPRPQTARRPHTHIRLADATGGYGKVFANPKSLLCFGVVFLEGTFFYGVTPYIAGLLEQARHGGAVEAGFVLGAFGLGGVLYSIVLPVLLRLMRRSSLMATGGVALTAGLVGLALVLPWRWLAILFAASGFGFMMLHNSIQAEVAELAPSARASAFAMHSFAFFLGQALGPIVTGLALGAWGAPALWVSAAILAITGPTAARLFRRFPTASGAITR